MLVVVSILVEAVVVKLGQCGGGEARRSSFFVGGRAPGVWWPSLIVLRSHARFKGIFQQTFYFS